MHDPDVADATLKWLGFAFQICGVVLLLLGVAVIRSWFERAADVSLEARRGFSRWWGLRVEQLRHWYANRRGHGFSMARHASDRIEIRDAATATVTRYRVDRATVSERDWLAHLDDRVEALFVLREEDQQKRGEDVSERRKQRDELRAEILFASQQGWRFVVAGLVLSAIGIILGAAA